MVPTVMDFEVTPGAELAARVAAPAEPAEAPNERTEEVKTRLSVPIAANSILRFFIRCASPVFWLAAFPPERRSLYLSALWPTYRPFRGIAFPIAHCCITGYCKNSR